MAIKRVGNTEIYSGSRPGSIGNRTIYQYTSKTNWDTKPRLLIRYNNKWYEVRKAGGKYVIHGQFYTPSGIHSLETGKRWNKVGRVKVYDYGSGKSLGVRTIYGNKNGNYNKILIRGQYHHVKQHEDGRWYY
jgi:hypothetical protein